MELRKKILITGMCFFLAANIVAKTVDENIAMKVGTNFLFKKIDSPVLRDASNLSLVYKGIGSESNITFYVYNAGQKGFVIVSGDDIARPILAYSDEGSFDPNNIAPGAKYWLECYSEQINYASKHRLNSSEEIASEWNEYTAGNITETRATAVGNLLTTTWHQGTYYNNLCPQDAGGPNGRCVTGCVATAMGQIFKYWNGPKQGSGSHSYTLPKYGPISANFGATTYSWNSMPNQLTSASTSAQVKAVATLLYHCGVGVDMQYGPGGSGCPGTDWVVSAIKTYFKYNGKVTKIYRPSYTDAQWIALLKTELNAKRPVYYCGNNATGGHAFVCTGYNTIDQFYFNMGWNGSNNGYYTINNIPSGFILQNEAVTKISPTASISGPTNLYVDGNPGTYSINASNLLKGNVTWTLSAGFSFDDGTLKKTTGAGSSVLAYADAVHTGTITVTNSTGGNLPGTLTLAIRGIYGANETEISTDVFIHSTLNLANSKVRISLPGHSVVTIVNCAGQLIDKINTADRRQNFDVSGYPKGLYIIRAKTQNGTIVKKFING